MIVNPASMVRKLVSLPHALIAAIEDFRFAGRIKTESEAIRRLIESGLQAEKMITADKIVSFCREKQKYDYAQVVESIVHEMKNPSDLPFLHSFPLPPPTA